LNSSGQFVLLPFFPEDILEFDRFPTIPEIHDRIIVGVAQTTDSTCITVDEEIEKSKLVKVVW
jgi:PIN domain nuclease of toxin-antitoxin system